MKINLRSGRIIRILLPLLLFSIVSISASAEMVQMSDRELSKVTGHGFSRFSLTEENGLSIARMDLSLQTATYTEIDSVKLGYYDAGAGTGWDQDWTALSLGAPDQDLSLNGFVLETRFQNIADSGARQLQSITVGYQNVTGTMTMDLNSFSGSLQGVSHQRADLGATTVTLNNEPLYITIDVNNGISFQIGN